MPKLILTKELRQSLKKPLGRLYPGTSPELYREIAQLASLKKPPKIILVGDAVSRNATATGLRRDVMIVDNKEMRGQVKQSDIAARRIFRVRNEPGTISEEAWACVDDAIRSGDALVIVDGEEDLLALVAVALAPIRSFVVYGQPNEGLVLIEVDTEARKIADSFFDCMIRSG